MSTPAKLAGCGTSKSHPDTLATHGPIVEETWSIEESKSPVDDSPQVAGMLYADSSTDPSYLMLPTVLVLRCKEKKTEAYLGRPFTLFGSNTNTVKVLVRINDGKPIETIKAVETLH